MSEIGRSKQIEDWAQRITDMTGTSCDYDTAFRTIKGVLMDVGLIFRRRFGHATV